LDPSPSLRRAAAAAATLVLVLVVPASVPAAKPSRFHPELSATFTHTTYVPGQRAELVIRGSARRYTLQVIRAGAERAWSSVGKPWGPARNLKLTRGDVHHVFVRIGAWDSGVYFARLTAPHGRAILYAPFILHPALLGRESRVAIVLPTYSWQAYNFWDANGDGKPDSWYADQHRHSVPLGRPYLDQGKPPHYRTQQRGFLRFLVHTGKQADYLSDEDLERIASGDDLAKLYDLIVFSGHEEYVTQHIYDVTQRYRDLGGNLAFLSADNFFWRVDLKDGKIWRVHLWRELGRPEAALIGVQYRGNDRGGHIAPYVVRAAEAAPWLFNGIDVANGSALGTAQYGIEFDATAPESPPGTVVLAEVDPNLAGGAIRGQMTYYETPAGARVFAAGTLSFGGSDNPTASILFENLWRHLVVP
jgi:hypothetical protein